MMDASALKARLTEQLSLGMETSSAANETQPAASASTPQFRQGTQPDAPRQTGGARLMSEQNKTLLRTMIAERDGAEGVDEIRSKLNRARDGGFLTTTIFRECFNALKAIPRPRVEQDENTAAPATPVLPIWPGIYTIETATGHRTFKVDVQDSDADFAAGETIISFLSGQNNEDDYTSFGFIKPGPKVVIWKRFRAQPALAREVEQFVADPAAALVAKHCARCGSLLTVPESVAAGFGPVCVTKGLR